MKTRTRSLALLVFSTFFIISACEQASPPASEATSETKATTEQPVLIEKPKKSRKTATRKKASKKPSKKSQSKPKTALAKSWTGLPAAGSSSGSTAPPINNFDEYTVKLNASSPITTPGNPGELSVWIGLPELTPDTTEGMVSAKGTLPATGETAKVTPFAPAFDITPDQSICVKIDPTGTTTRFELTPKKAKSGQFKIKADVYLYNSNDCSGAAIPKAVESLSVEVRVDRITPLIEIVWEKFQEFWGAIIALVFGLILFLIRKKLKKWFGFGG